jgi:pectate lyase
MRILPLLATSLLLQTVGAASPDFSLVGFATCDGGTTGGKGGQIVTPSTYADLKKYAEDPSTPYVIRITKEFNSGLPVNVDDLGNIVASGGIASTYGDILKVGSNKTLVGIGSSAFLNRIGIVIQTKSNVVIRNIKFTMKNVPIERTDENKIVGWVNGTAKTLSDPDCIGIQADDTSVTAADRKVRHIWIDHCEFYNDDPAVMTDVDRYDGLTDGKNDASDITVSWNYYHDHHKASLMGKGNSDDYDRHITYSHNYFQNIASRLPLIRFGKVHMLNNYMVTSENGTNARINSDVYIEGNHYKDSKKPVFGKVSENGAATFVSNLWDACDRVPQIVLSQAAGADVLSASEEVLVGTFKPSTFYSYKADAAADVAGLVTTWAGVGKISTTEYDPSTGIAARGGSIAAAGSRSGRIWIAVPAGTPFRIADTRGRVVRSGFASGIEEELPGRMEPGTYVVNAGELSRVVAVP